MDLPEDAHVYVAGWKGHEFTMYEIHELMFYMTNNNGYERKTTKHFIAVDINNRELLLGLPWVQRRNPTIEWRHNTWQHETKLKVKKISLSTFLDAAQSREPAFVTFVRTAHDVLQPSLQILAVRVHKVPNAYREFEDVFSDTFTQAVPKHSPWDHIIYTQDARVPYGPIYPLSKRQLQVL